jgi:hypothetical protein
MKFSHMGQCPDLWLCNWTVAEPCLGSISLALLSGLMRRAMKTRRVSQLINVSAMAAFYSEVYEICPFLYDLSLLSKHHFPILIPEV